MKKVICMLLLLGLAASFAACGGEEDVKNEQIEGESSATEVISNDSEEESSAEEVVLENLFEWQNVEGGIEITKYKGSDTVIVTPDIIENKKVVSLGTAFEGNVVVESLTISKYVTKIDLSGCDSLKKVYWNTEEFPITYYAANAKLPKGLEELYMPCVTNFYFSIVEDNGPNLKVLDISSCTAIESHSGDSLESVKLAAGGAAYAVDFFEGGDIDGLVAEEGKGASMEMRADAVWVKITDENRDTLYKNALGDNCVISFAE